MVEKKCWKIAIYGGVTSIIVCSAIIMFLFPDITWGDVKNSALYEMLKDHGSFIGGVLAIIGVYFVINNQNKVTKEVINSNLDVIINESFEVKRLKALECACLLRSTFGQKLKLGAQNSIPLNNDEVSSIYFLKYFLDKYCEDVTYSSVLTTCVDIHNGESSKGIIVGLVEDLKSSHRSMERRKEVGIAIIALPIYYKTNGIYPEGILTEEASNPENRGEIIKYTIQYVFYNLIIWILNEIDRSTGKKGKFNTIVS